MNMFGLTNFAPTIFKSSEQLKSLFGREFSGLLGYSIEKTWVLWNYHFDKWWTEWPVILQINNGGQLEVFVQDYDKLGLSWNSIDPKAPLFPDSNGTGDHLGWKEDALPELCNILGHKIKKISAIEYKFNMDVLMDRQNPQLEGKLIDFGWILNGIEFKIDDAYLSIDNRLSGCGISNSEIKEPDIRKKTIARKFNFQMR